MPTSIMLAGTYQALHSSNSSSTRSEGKETNNQFKSQTQRQSNLCSSDASALESSNSQPASNRTPYVPEAEANWGREDASPAAFPPSPLLRSQAARGTASARRSCITYLWVQSLDGGRNVGLRSYSVRSSAPEDRQPIKHLHCLRPA